MKKCLNHYNLTVNLIVININLSNNLILRNFKWLHQKINNKCILSITSNIWMINYLWILKCIWTGKYLIKLIAYLIKIKNLNKTGSISLKIINLSN